ncbi:MULTISPECIES: pantoate--beta-alanine ligase [Carboxydocella]|uniref:Pantothenate synthetase n=2 Tax=Carboxydocella TaxID=178898 RepID=A0A1T4RKU8_9FIRM|nr:MULTISPECIES: pantoate--beta-alanine ligase [Carboxydocella]AVX19312.1 pantoate--beta-alanine ligase [Carboxydocella thermautotrophica]GAW30381.1 Pantoate--beta-alanine ligase [Carboxydocella sp. JDF658]SKA16583.1 pantothenate synthetase [Carboxydocella sporoproducens DSM 16521]
MEIITSVREMQALARKWRQGGKSTGFVPTMGYLHEGHLTLMRKARTENEITVASIFVNPLQFGVGEDYEEYPRDLERDAPLAEAAGVDYLFVPTVREMYPRGYQTFVEVTEVTRGLCGASRPGHFRGVTTVVMKLFNIVKPDRAYFGWKDAQQVQVIRRMVEDLNLDVEIIPVPIVREADGLALSSRNVYLEPEERKAALVLSRSLKRAEELVAQGERQPEVIKEQVKQMIEAEPLAQIDYVELVALPDLTPLEQLQGQALLALAVRIGKTRLIDNTVLEVEG